MCYRQWCYVLNARSKNRRLGLGSAVTDRLDLEDIICLMSSSFLPDIELTGIDLRGQSAAATKKHILANFTRTWNLVTIDTLYLSFLESWHTQYWGSPVIIRSECPVTGQLPAVRSLGRPCVAFGLVGLVHLSSPISPVMNWACCLSGAYGNSKTSVNS